MRKDPSAVFHRLLLWGALLFAATLLIVNALLVINGDSSLLFTP